MFGTVTDSRNETWGCVETVRAIYETGGEIEYNFAAPAWAALPVDQGTKRVVTSGMKILFDPKRKLHALQRVVFAERAATH